MVSDVTVTEANCDVTMGDVNKPIARKRYAPKKHSLAQLKGFRKSSLSVHNQTFTKMALLLAIIITILGGMFNVTWPERKSAIGTSSRFSRSSEFTKPLALILPEPKFAREIWAGKRFNAYIFPSADFCASRLYYFDTYTGNLESDHNFMIFQELIYIYIYFKNTKNLFIHIARIPIGDSPRVHPNILKCLHHSPVAKGYRLVVIASRAMVCKTPTYDLILYPLAYARGCVICAHTFSFSFCLFCLYLIIFTLNYPF